MKKIICSWVKRAAAGSLACLMMTAAAGRGGQMESFGAESSVIENVSVTFKTTYGEQEEIPMPEITAGGGSYTIEDYQFRTDYEDWKPGKKVRVEITLAAEEGKVFPTSMTKSKCKVTGADFVSAKALEDDKFQVKADYKPVTVLGNTSKAGWSSKYKNRAVWKSVQYAPGYSVILYGDNKVVKRLTTGSATIDLAEYMKDEDKTYYYEVKAIPTTSDEKKNLKEGEFVASSEQEFDWEDTDSGTSDGGSIKGNNYILPNGQKDVNTWKKISGAWYYFDENGNMVRGWRVINGFWYYMNQNGVMQTGWVNPSDSNWFYLSPNGDMLTGWIQPEPGSWYYMDTNGYMQRNWIIVNGKHYYLGPDGKMRTGWVQDSGVWYYLYSDGSMATNIVMDGWTIGANGAASR